MTLAVVERERLLRLRALAAELERRPRSASRDALLVDVRRRIVAVEAGEKRGWAWRDTSAPGPEVTSAQIARELGAPVSQRRGA
jgi:hypothetical protein